MTSWLLKTLDRRVRTYTPGAKASGSFGGGCRLKHRNGLLACGCSVAVRWSNVNNFRTDILFNCVLKLVNKYGYLSKKNNQQNAARSGVESQTASKPFQKFTIVLKHSLNIKQTQNMTKEYWNDHVELSFRNMFRKKYQHQLSSCHVFIQVRESNTLWVSVFLCDFPIHLSRNIIRVQQIPFCFEWKAWHGRFPLNTSYQPSVVWIIWAPFPYLGRTSAAFASAKANSASSGSSWTHQFEQQQLPHTPESRKSQRNLCAKVFQGSCLNPWCCWWYRILNNNYPVKPIKHTRNIAGWKGTACSFRLSKG